MKSRESTSMVEAFQNVYEYLKKCGHKPKLNVMDNECSDAVKDYLQKEETRIKFVEADNHSVNASERAMQTIKNHFLAGLATVAKEFPIQLWCELLMQCQLTINLLHTSRLDPTKSAFEILEGKFDYNRTPICSPDINVLVHVDPKNRATCAPHALDG